MATASPANVHKPHAAAIPDNVPCDQKVAAEFSLPFLKDGKYRAFPVDGDSMPPYTEGAFVVARYIEHLREVKDGKTYILLTRNDGIVYKRVFMSETNVLRLVSDNLFYEP